MVYTCCAKHAYHNKTNRAKSLNENLGVEVNKTCCVCSLECVYANASKLKKHSLLQIEVVYYEISRALSTDEKVCCKPSCKRICITVVNKSEYALLVAKVSICRLVTANEAFATADNRGNDFVANLDRISCSISLNIFTESNDFSCSLVSESYRDKSERVALPLVNVSSANSTALNLNENVVVANLRNRELLNLDLLRSCEHCNLRSCGNLCA